MIIATLIVGFALSFGLPQPQGLYLWLPSGTDPRCRRSEIPAHRLWHGRSDNHHADAPQPHPMGRQNSILVAGIDRWERWRQQAGVSLSLDWLLLSVIGPTSFIFC